MAETPVTTPALKQTPLNNLHRQLGARMVEFGGWDMPVQYSGGILEEHRAVREAAGLFDVSHMGEFEIRGVPPGTHELLGEHPEAGRGRSRAAVRVVALETTSDVEVPLSGRIGAGAGTASGGFVEGVAAAVEAKSDGLVLSWVGQGSAADAAGLRVGDYLVSIDGETPRSAGRANALLRGPQGVRAVVVLIRGGRDTRFLVARETYRR